MKRLLTSAAFLGKFSLLGLAAAAVAIVIASRGGRGAAGSVERAAGVRNSYSEAVQASAPAVVSVYTSTLLREQRLLGFARDPQANTERPILSRPRLYNHRDLGSGVIVTPDGSILTNNHVIEGADSIWVGFWDGRLSRAEVVGSDPETDLAVLRVNMDGSLPTISYGRSSELQVGDVVLAIGNPLGLGRTVTLGIVSGTGRSGLGVSVYENLIQTDAAINKGNSGGALVNSRGELIGINTAAIGPERADGIGFAIPIETAQDVLEQILAHGEVVRGSLGIEMVDGRFSPRVVALNGNRPGVIVTEIHANGPGHLAGLEPGDYLTRFGDSPVTNVGDLYRTIADTPPGTRVELELWREGQRFTTQATLVQRRSAPAQED